jgi:aminoglycoside phosphotransferase (APT) family kinase protein
VTGRPAPGPLLASGRAADVYDVGGGRVLRRDRQGRDVAHEVLGQVHAATHGVPVPEVHDVDGPDVVMARVDGPTMVEVMSRRPWRAGPLARVLADLHRQVHEVPGHPDLPAVGTANGADERLLHLDLHPENVILSPWGPVIIDWANAARGPADVDVALTTVILTTTALSGGAVERRLVEVVRRQVVRSFRGAAAPVTLDGLAGAAAYRLADANLSDDERGAVRRLLEGSDP